MTEQIEFSALYDGKEFKVAHQAIWALYQSLDDGYRLRLPPIVRDALERYLRKVATVVATRNSGSWPGGTSGSSLSRRSGNAFKSIHDSVKVTGGRTQLYTLRGHIGGNFYLKTHEFGATIKAKGNGWLTIPLPAALRSNGTPIAQSAREWNDTFIIKSKKGNLLIVRSRRWGTTQARANGFSGNLVLLYVLKKQVKIPARLGMSLTLDQLAFSFMQDVLRETRREFFG